MTIAANNKANVSTTRGVAGGYLFRAPVGTSLPSAADYPTFFSTALDSAWENVGYLTTDGVSRSTDGDSDEMQDMNLDVVDVMDAAKTDTITFHPMEVSPASMKLQYGSANVSVADSGVMTVKSKWSLASEHCCYIARFILKNGRRWDRVIPDAVVSNLGEETQNKSTGTGRDVTLKLSADSDGTTIYDYYAPVSDSGGSVEAKLTALTISDVTLSPTFASGTIAYTGSAGSSVTTSTVTATAASGCTTVITVNGNSIASGGTATWVTGENVVKVTVANGEVTRTYSITVNKAASE